MAASEFSATSYISHHLTHLKGTLFGGTIHIDTVVTSFVLGLVALWLLRTAAARATSGVPGKWQAAVELLIEFVDGQVRSVYPGSRAFVGPLALTVFVWVLLMNAMDFLPIDIMAQGTQLVAHEWRLVPTADMNTTFALAFSVFGLMIFFNIKSKGFGGWLRELFTSPFGSNPLVWPFNLVFQLVEYVSKPLSHSLRLYGNMYAGELIFMLLWVWAASGAVGVIFGGVLALGWAIFHILIVLIQAFLFMILAAVYIAMAQEHH